MQTRLADMEISFAQCKPSIRREGSTEARGVMSLRPEIPMTLRAQVYGGE